jgi:hypothetical protein
VPSFRVESREHPVEFIVLEVSDTTNPSIMEQKRLIPAIRLIQVAVSCLGTVSPKDYYRNVLLSGAINQDVLEGLSKSIRRRTPIEQNAYVLLWETVSISTSQ